MQENHEKYGKMTYHGVGWPKTELWRELLAVFVEIQHDQKTGR